MDSDALARDRLGTAKRRWGLRAVPEGAAAALVVALAYYLAAHLGFAFTLKPHPISTLWPPNALLLAVLLIAPARTWWWLLAAVLPAHLAAELQSGVPTAMVLGWYASNCSEALIGAALVAECGSESQKQAMLPKVADGSLCLAFAHAERAARFDLAHVETTAWRTDFIDSPATVVGLDPDFAYYRVDAEAFVGEQLRDGVAPLDEQDTLAVLELVQREVEQLEPPEESRRKSVVAR